MSLRRISVSLLTILLLSMASIGSAQAQTEGGWSEPYRLSTTAGRASEGYCVADHYGYVHCFWSETLFENQNNVIKYARFDGTTWTKPNDIYVAGQEIKNISPFLDQHDILHIAWTEGLYDIRAYYTFAPANSAISAQNWAKPLRILAPARPIYLRVDSKGVLHILYTNQTEETGVYYIRSEDKGLTWSEPLWLDPDIPPDHVPDSLNFELDENDGLHAVWWYGGINRARPDWVRYSHSLDGGHTWSEPFTIDRYIEGSDHNLTNASPTMIVQGKNVHVIWAAGLHPYRYHRYSTDGGVTWSMPVQVFGELHGQAFDGLTVDPSGRVHFFGQIRYPMGIYYAYWDNNRWSTPSLIYWIADEGTIADEGALDDADSENTFGDRVHAHFTLPVIRAGNQLVLTFTDGPADPNRRLFAMYHNLDDIPPLESLATPTPLTSLLPTPSPTPEQQEPTATATEAYLNFAGQQPVGEIPKADFALELGIIPVLLILGGTFIYRLLYKNRP